MEARLDSVPFARIDAAAERRLVKRLEIHSLPALLLVRAGRSSLLEIPHEFPRLRSFIDKLLKPAVCAVSLTV